MSTHKNLGPSTAEKVDAEISRIVNEQYARAKNILEEKRNIVERMTKALMEWETINMDQIDDIMKGKEPQPPADWDDSDDSTPNASSTDETEEESKKEEKAKESKKGPSPRVDKPAGGEAQ
jgi:cell division protease FtsH